MGSEKANQKKEVGKLSVEISGEAIRAIIGSGRLLELADTLAVEAAAQISAQIVERVAEAAVDGGIKGGVGASVSFIFDGGDFGTVPPRPKRGIVQLEALGNGALRRIAAAAQGQD